MTRPFTPLGGRLASGGDATNALSFLILRSASEFPLDYPYLGVRIHKDTPEEFLREICRATQKNGASPVLFNDDNTQISKLLIDGCSMGIKTLGERRNTLDRADKKALALADRIIRTEEDFIKDLRGYL